MKLQRDPDQPNIDLPPKAKIQIEQLIEAQKIRNQLGHNGPVSASENGNIYGNGYVEDGHLIVPWPL